MKTANPKLHLPKIVASSRRGVKGYRILQSNNGYQFQGIYLTAFQLGSLIPKIKKALK